MGKTAPAKVQSGIEFVKEMLYQGKGRKDIVPVVIEKYKISEGCADKWIRKAKPAAEEMIAADAMAFKQQAEINTRERVAALNIKKTDLIERYHSIAFGDVRKLYGAGNILRDVSELSEEEAAMLDTVEVMEETDRKGNVIGYTRKIKRNSALTALDKLTAILGYNAPTKTAFTDSDGNPLPAKISLNLG